MILKSYEIRNKKIDFEKNNFFLLYGENFGLKKDIKNYIISQTKKGDESIEQLSFYEKEVLENEENLFNFIFSGSLFSNKKVAIINEATDKIIKKFEDLFSKNFESTTIIVLSEILDKKSKLRNLFEKENKTICIPCYLDNERDLQFIADLEFKKNKLKVSREIINLLIEKSNFDRNNLRNEIEKIISFAHNKNKIELDDIKNLINFSGEYKSDILINECLCGNISEYKKIISELYVNTINQVSLLRIFSYKIHRLLKIKEQENEVNNLETLINNSRPPIFWKEKPLIKKQLSIWSLVDLKAIINEINNTEILCKKNPQISKNVFFNFFSKICKKANSFS
tara:strand:- start:1071 stop:2090 length:1020 start_codon:yes stop_codon:yes gene_type:complete